MIDITDFKDSTIRDRHSARSSHPQPLRQESGSAAGAITGQSQNTLITPNTADLTMSDSEELHYLDHSVTQGGDDGVEIYKTMSNEIKSVRVELDYTRPTNEQAPRGLMARTLSGGGNRGDRPTFEKANSALLDLANDRQNSFNKGTTTTQGIPIPPIPSNNNSTGKKKKSRFTKMSSRTKKILAESNFSDDQANAAGSPSQCNFLLATMLTGISYYYVLSLLAIVAWTCASSYYMDELRALAEDDAKAKLWIGWLDETDVRMIGSLFVFSLVFRFNQCYNRWWQGRMLWGEIIQNCLDFSRKSTLWCLDRTFSDRLNRYIVCFPYAAKAQLRGLSLTDESESGQSLVDRGFLAQEELDFLKENPCWEPEFFLDLMRATVAKIILAQWEREPDEQVLLLPHSNRIHDRLFPPWDKAIYDLGNSIGEGVSVRSAGLPRSYDTVHYVFFWIYFTLAPPCEAATIGWMAPIVVGFSACIIMTLMDMGTAMVDPFGTDLVDLPIERFCETIEAQVLTIQRRHATGKILEFASFSTPGKRFVSTDPTNRAAAKQISLTH